MNKGRLEAFSDGVLAIIITIMVFEIKAPKLTTWAALGDLWPVLVSYGLSFLSIAIYWNNHHHMLQTARKINGNILWANMHLLFWLTLIPFATNWLGSSGFAQVPSQLYGIVLLMCGVAYKILAETIVRSEPGDSLLAQMIGSDFKGIGSLVGYVLSIIASFRDPIWSLCIYGMVSAVWFIPDRRIESKLSSKDRPDQKCS